MGDQGLWFHEVINQMNAIEVKIKAGDPARVGSVN